MSLKPQKYLLGILLFITQELFPQSEVSRYPVRFSQYYNCFSMENPAAAGSSSKFELAGGNQKLLGSYSKISTYYLNVNMHFNQAEIRSRKPFSVAGLLFYNDKEGKYINRTRFYATYVWHAHLTRNLKMSGGFRLGGMNYSVKGTPLSGDGSDFVPDGAIGLQLYNHKYHLGISLNQIFNNTIQPLEEVTKLGSFLNFTGGIVWGLSSAIQMKPVGWVQVPIHSGELLADVSLLTTYKEKIDVVLGIHNNDMVVHSIGLKNVLNSKYILDVNLTYSYPVNSVGVSTSFFEVGINISFD